MLSMFENKKVNLEKLVAYGFTRNNDVYTFTTNIVNGQFQMIVAITEDETVNTKVLDSASNEYVLHRIPDACGPFVSKVRADYVSILHNIAEKCFEPNIFKSNYAQKNHPTHTRHLPRRTRISLAPLPQQRRFSKKRHQQMVLCATCTI